MPCLIGSHVIRSSQESKESQETSDSDHTHLHPPDKGKQTTAKGGGKLKNGGTLNLRFTARGYTCRELLNELGHDACLGFHVTSGVMPTPADLGWACLALSPTIVYTTHFAL